MLSQSGEKMSLNKSFLIVTVPKNLPTASSSLVVLQGASFSARGKIGDKLGRSLPGSGPNN